jgi:hypothetical protein
MAISPVETLTGATRRLFLRIETAEGAIGCGRGQPQGTSERRIFAGTSTSGRGRPLRRPALPDPGGDRPALIWHQSAHHKSAQPSWGEHGLLTRAS